MERDLDVLVRENEIHVSEAELKRMVTRLLRGAGQATQETIRFYVLVTLEVKAQQAMLRLLEAGEIEATLKDGSTGKQVDDYLLHRKTSESRSAS